MLSNSLPKTQSFKSYEFIKDRRPRIPTIVLLIHLTKLNWGHSKNTSQDTETDSIFKQTDLKFIKHEKTACVRIFQKSTRPLLKKELNAV